MGNVSLIRVALDHHNFVQVAYLGLRWEENATFQTTNWWPSVGLANFSILATLGAVIFMRTPQYIARTATHAPKIFIRLGCKADFARQHAKDV